MKASSTLFVNGKFFAPAFSKSSAQAPFVDTMAIENGIIAYIGASSPDLISQAKESSSVTIQDMQKRTILPGFIDGHMHFLLLGQSLQKLSLEGSQSLDEIRARIVQYAQENPQKPRVLCRGWMHSMTDGEARKDMLDDLDVGGRPIFIDSKDLHSAWCNSAALAELGVEDMKDPLGGVIHRDGHGKADGLLSEAAMMMLVWPHLAQVATMQEKTEALKAAITEYNEAGYTGMVDMAMDENGWEALLELRKQEDMSMRLSAYWLISPSDSEEARVAQVDRAIALNKTFNTQTSPDFRLVGIKVICDGVIDACTAALCEPYSSNGVSAEPLWTKEMLAPVVQRADEAGLQCALHAIGDAAIHLAVNVLESCCSRGRRHRIEHLELASPEDARRLGELGITASIQPVHADPAILRAWPRLLGEQRLARAFAYREFLDGGATLALGSDSPTAPFAPMRNLYTATTRRSAREPHSDAAVNSHFALSLCESVSAATEGAAYSCFADTRVGSLKQGMCADFVVLDMDWEPNSLLQAVVRETWFAGKRVYGLA